MVKEFVYAILIDVMFATPPTHYVMLLLVCRSTNDVLLLKKIHEKLAKLFVVSCFRLSSQTVL